MADWEDLMTPEEQQEIARLKEDINRLRDELVSVKTQFDRACTDLYLFGRAIREQRGHLYASDLRGKKSRARNAYGEQW